MINNLISVIVPVYMGKSIIKRSIESLLVQEYKNFELIIVDDCSDDYDDMREVVLKIIPEAKIFKMEKKGNAAVSRNFGVEKSSGSIIAFLDADDEFHPEKLKLLNKAANMNGDCSVFLNSVSVKNKNTTKNIIHQADFIDCGLPEYCLFYGNLIQTSSISIRKSIAGKLKFDESYNRFQDYTYIANISKLIDVGAVMFYERQLPLSFWNISDNYGKKAKNLGESLELVDKFILEYGDLIGKKASFGFLLRHGIDVRKNDNLLSSYLFGLKMILFNPILMLHKVILKIKV